MLVTIVDDRAASLDAYAKLLTRIADVSVKTFVTPIAGLEWCRQNAWDLLILDFSNPSEAVTLIQRVRAVAEHSESPIVIVTGDMDRDTRRKALEVGASDYLTKPVDPIEFLARMRNQLALRESRRQLEAHATSLAAEVARATKEIADREQETINRLVRAAEYRDGDTGMHIVRMGHYAALLGKATGLSEDEQRLLLLATPMHDVDKVSTPDAILLKRGKLTDAEWMIMKDHARVGYQILAGSSSRVLQLAAEIALSHHEKWDGSGYPHGAQGTDIPLAARIAAIGDVFDALISERPYKRAWTQAEAFQEIRTRSGSHFDPLLAEAFLDHRFDVADIAKQFADGNHVSAAVS
jgi:response regulator RpfG family c-di-GMP phosphodiesterase